MLNDKNTMNAMILFLVSAACLLSNSDAFSFVSPHVVSGQQICSHGRALEAISVGKSYTPKWKKKQTLAEEMGGNAGVSLEGNVPVVFQVCIPNHVVCFSSFTIYIHRNCY